MPAQPLQFQGVTFGYESCIDPVVKDLTVQFAAGWCGIIGANGSGKTTLLRLACGQLKPLAGAVFGNRSVVYCPQRTDEPPDSLDDLLRSSSPTACSLRGRLQIEAGWAQRWDTLSHGERKRAQIATALWLAPDVLAIDEPTNHIDSAARSLLLQAMQRFGGIGLLVSHDRELLDSLCSHTVFMEPPSAVLRPGGYTKAQQLIDAERQRAQAQRAVAKRQFERLRDEASNRLREAAQADRKRSKRHLAKGDSDGRARINLARVSGKDGQAGRIADQLDGRLRQAQARLDAVKVSKAHRLGIELLGEPSRRNVLLDLGPGELPLGSQRRLHFDKLHIDPSDRIAIVGPNGAGKSTLVRHVLACLPLPAEKIVYMPQEIDRDRAVQVLRDVRSRPDLQLGAIMSAISCLGSRPDRLLQSDEPSPGETRKLLLALGLSQVPNLIIMDEPTNHLDLPSIRCMEEALSQVQCALLLVSHDKPLLRRVTQITWTLTLDRKGRSTRCVCV